MKQATLPTKRTGWGRRALLAASLAAAAALPQPGWAMPAALDQAPEKADLVLLVPSLSGLSGDLAMLASRLNIPSPELADALASFKRSTGMTQGLNDAGSMMLIIPDLAAAIEQGEQGGEPPMLLLAPVSDYAAFVGNFGGSADDAIATLIMPGNQPAFAKRAGDYAVVSPTRSVVESFEAGGGAAAVLAQVGQVGERALDGSDIAVYLNIEAMAPTLLPKIDQAVAEFNAMMQNEAQGVPPETLQQMRAAMDLYAAAGKAVLEGGRGVVAGLRIDEQGIALHKAFGMKADSNLAGYFPGGQADARSALATLPSEPYIIASSVDTKAIAIDKIMEKFVALAPGGAEGEVNPTAKLYADALPLMKQLNANAWALYAPAPGAMMGGGLLRIASVYMVDDGEKYMADNKAYMESLNGVSIPMMPAMGDQPAQEMTYRTEYVDNAMQLEGLEVDQFSFGMQFPPQMMQQLAFLQMIFPNFGYSGYLVAKGDRVVMTTALDPQLVSRTIKGLDAGTGIASAGKTAAIRERQLPTNTVMEAYISFEGLLSIANQFAPMMGIPPIEVPGDLAPIAAGMSLDDHTIDYRMFVPLDSVEFVVKTAQDVAATMQGAGGEGAPPAPTY